MPREYAEILNATPAETALDAWIARATHGLCAQAKERVRREITEHHSGAFNDLCSAGELPDMAYGQALEGLGDAKAANKAFRKTYLTSWQERLLASLARPAATAENRGKYEVVALVVFMLATAALNSVCRTYQLFTPYQSECFFLSLLTTWTAIGGVRFVQYLHDMKQRQRGLPPKSRRSGVNRAYSWFLMVATLVLYAVWRSSHLSPSPAGDLHSDLGLLLAGFLLSSMLHPRIRSSIFGSSWQYPKVRGGLICSYVVLLVLGSVAVTLWPPSWLTIRTLIGLEPHPYDFVGNDVHSYGTYGLILAIVLLVTAARWAMGFFLLQKNVKCTSSDKDASRTYPETPLGE